MTGYTVHTGSNERYSEGWDRVFSQPAETKSSKGKSASKNPKPDSTQNTAAPSKPRKSSKAKKST